jgi:hypothetical protein
VKTRVVVIGILLGFLSVVLADYVSKRLHCYSGRWTPDAGWVCKVPRPEDAK